MIPEILEQLVNLTSDSLQSTAWKEKFYDCSFLTEEVTGEQAWFENFPALNPFAACFLASAVSDG